MKSHAMGASTDISCVPSSVQDAASYAFENGTEFLLTKTALAAAVPEAFSYAKGILLLIVTYLAWEQGYMLASRWANAGSISDDMSISLNVVSDAAAFCDSFKRSAMRSRMQRILTWYGAKTSY